MKFTAISTIFLATGSAIAAPSSMKRATTFKPIIIQNWSAENYSNFNRGTMVFAMNDPNANTSTDCSVTWEYGLDPPKSTMVKCNDDTYEFGFLGPITSIDDFSLKVARSDGTWSGQYSVNSKGEDWECKNFAHGAFSEKCDWVGALNLGVIPPNAS
ncbi:hypothetical protein N7474_009816 [Penicillium riverlandense]|uniref:uncharacterized protein n=1 Tax=Penicillium riverlandense TaxID=1903569 RepID=UPI002546ABF7|nr:uncharacterized protein N7474_009816 [Penicillium riverlandense]KAJ5808547.1 hypothetical protein N7474_009816 [Penicillium riverlandense]